MSIEADCKICGATDVHCETVHEGVRMWACETCRPQAFNRVQRCPIDRVEYSPGMKFSSVEAVNSARWWRNSDHQAALAAFHADWAAWKRTGESDDDGIAAPWDGQVTSI